MRIPCSVLLCPTSRRRSLSPSSVLRIMGSDQCYGQWRQSLAQVHASALRWFAWFAYKQPLKPYLGKTSTTVVDVLQGNHRLVQPNRFAVGITTHESQRHTSETYFSLDCRATNCCAWAHIYSTIRYLDTCTFGAPLSASTLACLESC